jgi:lipopolysaccharide export system protein LptA
MILLIASALLLGMFPQPNETVLSINSKNADYDGKRIILTEDVTVDHEIGKLTADQIILSPTVVEGKTHWHSLSLEGNVNIVFKDGGKVSCNSAEIDYGTLQGYFFGSEEKQLQVNYIDNTGSLRVTGDQMIVQLSKNEGAQTAVAKSIGHIKADGKVSIHYRIDFIAIGDHAIYDNPSIALYGEGQNRTCEITNSHGDKIAADHIRIHILQRNIAFTNPKGSLSLHKQQNSTDPIYFSGDTLVWEELKNLLTLKGNVIVSQEGFGQMTNDDEVLITQHIVNEEKELKSIESTGTTVLIFQDALDALSHTLNCHGKVYVDHERLLTLMESPRDASGNVLEGKQLSFQDIMGDIYADRMRVDYKMIDQSLSPSKLNLEGHVRILNRFARDSSHKENFLQYALAENVEYSPDAKEVILSTKSKNRVLFFDKMNNLQVSAPSLSIRRDAATKKELVQGRGDVRFSFIKRELDEIYKQLKIELK